ncbi:hypothetical protein HNQ07_002500 [Deinococcus metalli]|uniref:Putative metal-dependent hydrolase GCM10017781_27480 n=1 Tax=Deinococcus metalli TaxID=1141878 RepID=A0A7W8KF37_9DEIO|nr:putative metal-dependent hydrolase [Deinococcus metalli]MBB5377027.1 hypothetical protein [Deinococcus metalli]GHF49456.1 putative metal-dependent hydrolase [Deinococcus metalli]
MTDPRYPIGPMPIHLSLSPEEREAALGAIRALPVELRAAAHGLDDAQLDTPYREGGWSVRQVVHHVADSHMNAYVRVKLALTEDNPTVKPYEEQLWAELPDSALPPALSLELLDGLHTRLVTVLGGVTDFAREWTHPAQGRTYTLDTLLGMYAWHGRHHVAHITGLRERQGW